MNPSPFASFLAPASLILMSGCAATGPFPSLAPRAIERELAEADAAEARPVLIPDNPDLALRVNALLVEAKNSQAEFERAADEATDRARTAGPAGSDSWIEAQQVVSRLESARATILRALADLDALGLARASEPTSTADLARIQAAMAEAQALADAQQERIERLESSLSPG